MNVVLFSSQKLLSKTACLKSRVRHPPPARLAPSTGRRRCHYTPTLFIIRTVVNHVHNGPSVRSEPKTICCRFLTVGSSASSDSSRSSRETVQLCLRFCVSAGSWNVVRHRLLIVTHQLNGGKETLCHAVRFIAIHA